MKKISSTTAWVITFVIVIFAALMLVRTNQTSTIINFDEFQKDWTNNTIKSFQVKEDQMSVSGTLKDGTAYETVVPSTRLFQFIQDHPKSPDVQETYQKPATIPMWLQYLPTVLLILMLVGFWFIFMKQSQGGGGSSNVMKFGKSKAKLANPDRKK